MNSDNVLDTKEAEETAFKNTKTVVFNLGYIENGSFTPVVAIVRVRPKAAGFGCTVEYTVIMDLVHPDFYEYTSLFEDVLKNIGF